MWLTLYWYGTALLHATEVHSIKKSKYLTENSLLM